MRGISLILLLVLLRPLAWAAPWVQDDGGLYTRIAVASEEIEGLQAYRGDIYAEYGWTKNWTLTSKLEAVAFEEAQDFNAQGWRVSARRKVLKRGNLVGSIEFGALQGAAISGLNGCETIGVEMRAGAAWSGKLRKIDTFAFAEAAGRIHTGCQRHRYALGIGQRATKNIWVVTQVWIDRGSQNTKSDKVQTELLWKGKVIEASIGYRQELGGQFEEQGIFIALAKRY